MCVLLTNIPTPYRIPVWKEINTNINLEVICISKIEKNRLWNIQNLHFISFLKSRHLFFEKLDWGFHFTIPFSLFFRLVKKNPEVVIITGYDNYQYWEALLYIKIFKKKSIFWNGSTLLSSRSENKLVNMVKSIFINNFDGYYTYGTKATEYLINFGVNNENIVTGRNTVDSDFFKISTQNASQNDEIVRFIYVGQLLERKGLDNTLKAFNKIKNSNWELNIVGTGADEKKLKNMVLELGLSNKVNFLGYKQQEDILEYFSMSDILVMPSYLEVWGLVLNEGLASGLFCLASKYAGSTFDLIEEGKNGFIIDPFDIKSFTTVIGNSMNIKFDKKQIKDSLKVSPITESAKILKAIEKVMKND